MEKFSGQEFTIEDLKNDEDLIKFMAPQKGKKKSKVKVTPTERATSDYECHQCDARVWEKGFGGQCSRKKVDGECMCQMHLKAVAKEGKWWLGVMTEPRPEVLEHPSGRPHEWKITADGEEVVKEKKKSPKKSSPKAAGAKKKPGRPKGSKNKSKSKSADSEKDEEIAALQAKLASLELEKEDTTKKITVDESDLKNMNGWEAAQVRKAAAEGNEEVMADLMESKDQLMELDEKQEEQVPDNSSEATQAYKAGDGDYDEDGNKDITYEGVKYKIDRDGDVINPDDYSCVGSFDEDTGVMTFHGEDEEAIHEAKK